MNHAILFDTEYTAWEGSKDRNWQGDNEYREIIQIGAIRVHAETLKETDSFLAYVRPVRNPVLSEYITTLTGVTEEILSQEGTSLDVALSRFAAWSNGEPLWSYGNDMQIVRENCSLVGIDFPPSLSPARDIRRLFQTHGVDTSLYMSSTIAEAFGRPAPYKSHDAVGDARGILAGLVALRAESGTVSLL